MQKISEIFQILRKDRKRGVEYLYSVYYHKMYGIAFSIVQNEQKSEDIVHNFVLKILSMKEDLLPVKGELKWLYISVKNTALSYRRKEKIERDIDTVILDGKDKNIEDFVDMESFYAIIKTLDEERREVVTLKILGGYTHREIAQMLSKPIGTIQWLFNTSIKKLKVSLAVMFVGFVSVFVATIWTLWGTLTYHPTQNPSLGVLPSSSENPFLLPLVVLTIVTVLFAVVQLIIYTNSDKISVAKRKVH